MPARKLCLVLSTHQRRRLLNYTIRIRSTRLLEQLDELDTELENQARQ